MKKFRGFLMRRFDLCSYWELEKAKQEIRLWKGKWNSAVNKAGYAMDGRDRWRERAYRYAEEAMVWKEKYEEWRKQYFDVLNRMDFDDLNRLEKLLQSEERDDIYLR